MSECAAVLDSSAVLALLWQEPGEDVVAPLLGRAAWSAVNMCEVAGKLTDRGLSAHEVREALDGLSLEVHDFDAEMGFEAADLRRIVPLSLSAGDRACLALARRLRLPAITAQQGWKALAVDELIVTLIR